MTPEFTKTEAASLIIDTCAHLAVSDLHVMVDECDEVVLWTASVRDVVTGRLGMASFYEHHPVIEVDWTGRAA